MLSRDEIREYLEIIMSAWRGTGKPLKEYYFFLKAIEEKSDFLDYLEVAAEVFKGIR